MQSAIRRDVFGWAAGALIVAAVYALHAAGLLARLEAISDEARAKLLAREVASDIVIVAIDSHSLRELDEWPWPRRHYARLLQHLSRQPPRTLFLDIDFSSHASAQDDELFERALAEWPGAPVLLAAHAQPLTAAGGELAATEPLPRFAEHAALASVVLEPDADGFLRSMPAAWPIGGRDVPSVFARDAALENLGGEVPIDFSILPSSFGYVSFSDLLNAEVDFGALAGKDVYVGATAVELRDVVTVPVYRALPGVVVQALAAESARAGVLRTLPAPAYALLLALLTAACVALCRGRSWRRNALVLAAALPLVWLAGVFLYAAARIVLPVVPFGLGALFVFAAATLRSLDSATWRALAYSIGLERRGALLRSIFESSSDCILCVDADGRIRAANPASARLFACELAQVQGTSLGALIPELAGADLLARAGTVAEHGAVDATGRRFPVEVGVSRAGNADGPLFTAIVRDITEREAQRRALEHQATHDALTGLPNRLALGRYLETALARAHANKRLALLMLDLCRFKEVNDTLGHDVGDAVLREVGKRFAATLTERAFVSRIGGDEFTVVLPEVSSTQAIDALSQQLAECLQAPIHVQGVAIEVGLSIGIALWPDHAREAPELLRRADVAMYAAKRRGSSYEYYASDLDRHTVRQLSMISELRSALAREEIELQYQPQVNLRTGQCDGVEALLRWEHPMLGRVSPAEFVTLAESTDLIQPLTEWSIERALADASGWHAQGERLRVAVNLSARVLQDAGFPLRLARLLASRRFDPSSLELEITESAMLVDPERAKRVVLELHALGVQIAIDDYGTGFSSLGYLRDLRANTLKLDKSFVTDLEVREDNRVIVQSTVDMAHALGLSVVAEGVETEWQQQYLANAGYDSGQGYLFARPMPSRECLAWLARWNAPAERRAVPT